VLPNAAINPFFRGLLEAPNPRHDGFYDATKGEFVSTAPPGVSRRQWEYYRETGCLLWPLWVVQGSGGGHQYRFSHLETEILKELGHDPALLIPGDLPYADPDARTWARIEALDRMKLYGFVLGQVEKVGVQLDQEERDSAVRLRTELSKFLDEQFGEAAEIAASNAVNKRSMRTRAWEDAPPADPRLEEKLELAEHEFIHHGV
jgi:hypothetical protein